MAVRVAVPVAAGTLVAEDDNGMLPARPANMKQWTAVISVVVVAAVLGAVLGIGLLIRETVFQRARSGSPEAAERDSKLTGEQPGRGPGGPRMGQSPSVEDRQRQQQQRARMVEQMADMSPQEQERFRAQVRRKFDAGQGPDRQRFGRMPPEERAKLAEQWQGVRQRWENMSEQEREAVRAQLRERFGGAPPADNPAPPDLDGSETILPQEQQKQTGEQQNSTSPDENTNSGTE